MAKRASGEGTIRRRENGKGWYAKLSFGFDEDGKRIRKTVSGQTQTEVRKKLEALKAKRDRGESAKDTTDTVSAYLDEWLDDVVSGQGTRTGLNYARQVRLRIKPHLGRKKLAMLKATTIQAWLADMRRAGETRNQIFEAFSVLRCALNSAVSLEHIPRNVCQILKDKPKKPDGKKVKPLEVEQANLLAAECWDHRLGSLPMIAILTGLRTGELFALEWTDIVGKTLRVERAMTDWGTGYEIKAPKTKESRRTVALGAEALKWLERRRELASEAGLEDCSLVFSNTKGGYLRRANFRKQVWKPLCGAVGVEDFTFHELRHTHASLMIAAKAHPKTIQAKLGHAKIATPRSPRLLTSTAT